ncbi:Nn.00g032950.m01.CDS01 [Neocucurbitaria sp. VM-36]
MCWCFNFGFSSNRKRKNSSSGEKKRRDKPDDALHGKGKTVVTEVSEKRRSGDATRKRRSGETVTPRSPRREREEHRPRSQQYYEDVYQSREQYRPALNVQVPDMYHRPVNPGSTNSSQEALLNPRPHRSQHTRQRHPKRTSQTTLRGRGAKRDPPRHSKSKKNVRPEPSRGWSLFAPSPPKTPKRDHRNYQTLDSSPRSHRSSRHQRSPQATVTSESAPSQARHHRSRQHERSAPSTRQARSRTPNTAARRVPDRRFAVLAATNQALEDVRREAFAQPSPPPRRERLRRYEGVAIPTSAIPFNWDCVSSSQTSAGYGNAGSSRERRSRR